MTGASAPACPVCRAPGALPFARVDAKDYLRCPACEARFLEPTQRLSPAEEHAHYLHHENDVDDPRYRRFLSKLADPLLAKLKAPSRGLDYGCGAAPALAAMLAEAGHDVALYDHFFQPDPAPLGRTYDFITCTEVLEHFHDPAAELERLDALLAPGGWLAVMTCFQDDDARFASWHYRRDPTHVVFYRESTLRAIAARHGFSCEIPAKDVALMQKPSIFPETYAASRAAFVREVSARGAALASHPHPRRGPDGEELFLDVARFGAPVGEATRVLFVGAGTHGVEGRVGAGILRALVAQGTLDALPRGLAVVLLHAINPYGFAHDRRVDHENIDVNRNFLDHSSPLPANEHYEALRRVLNSDARSADALGGEATLVTLALYALLHGKQAMFRGAGGGQYRHPDELAYAGAAPCWSNRTIRTVWAEHVDAGVDLGVFIDLHSGLGPCGVGTILQGADADDPRAALARELFGEVHRTPRPGPGRTIVFGELVTAFEDASAARRSLGVILEIGTLDLIRVFAAVRAESWLHRRGDPRSPEGRAIRQAMRDAFFVDEPRFRDAALARGLEVVEDAIAAMRR